MLVTEFMAPAGLELLSQEVSVLYRPGIHAEPGDLAGCLAESQGLVVRNQTRVDPQLLAAGPLLQVVGRLGAGLDNVDVAAAGRRGIRVVYAPEANTEATAEFAFALILALTRNICLADRHARQGRWERSSLAGTELAGKHLGILGTGRTGLALARRARAFNMQILGYHPRKRMDDPDLAAAGVQLTDLERLLATVDILSIHLPARPDTAQFLNRERISRLKPGAYLVNTSRGSVVDEAGLFHALESGRLAGAALDVRRREPPPMPDPFAGLPNVILTPHLAGISREAQEQISLEVATDVLRVLGGLEPRFPVAAH